MIEFTDNIGRSISPPLRHDEADAWLKEYDEKQLRLKPTPLEKRINLLEWGLVILSIVVLILAITK